MCTRPPPRRFRPRRAIPARPLPRTPILSGLLPRLVRRVASLAGEITVLVDAVHVHDDLRRRKPPAGAGGFTSRDRLRREVPARPNGVTEPNVLALLRDGKPEPGLVWASGALPGQDGIFDFVPQLDRPVLVHRPSACGIWCGVGPRAGTDIQQERRVLTPGELSLRGHDAKKPSARGVAGARCQVEPTAVPCRPDRGRPGRCQVYLTSRRVPLTVSGVLDFSPRKG